MAENETPTLKPVGKIVVETYNGADVPTVRIFGEVSDKDLMMLQMAVRRAFFDYIEAIAKEERRAVEEKKKEENKEGTN